MTTNLDYRDRNEISFDAFVDEFLQANREGVRKREWYCYARDGYEVPEGKVVRVTIELVSEAKLNNLPEK